MTEVPINQIGDYLVLRELAPGLTFLATGPGRAGGVAGGVGGAGGAGGGRKVVLKRLEEDCLFEGRLHVSIKERLARIQEVAHGGVANLYGVERVGDFVFLVWEYIEGVPLEEYLVKEDARGRLPDLMDVGRELVMSVEGLTRLGLVHGALHGGNIIVTDKGIRLTHLSPYLYTDPQEDARAVIELLLESLNTRYRPGDLPMHRLLTRAAEEGYDLARLGPLLACPPDSPLSPIQMAPRQARQRGRRRRSVLAALLVLLAGAGVGAWALYLGGAWPEVDWRAGRGAWGEVVRWGEGVLRHWRK
jgi:tRNA A-37 threonylcarbamoyl transferase component Bud32